METQYNPKKVEHKVYQRWLEQGVFSAKVNPKKKPFSIVIPPPNVTGILHMGHALNNTIQDVLSRFKRLKGYESLWLPGTDHAGIATQNVVEKDLAKKGLKKEDLGRKEFLKRLWAWQNEYGSTIIEQLKKLGSSCDWERTRFTMDQSYSLAVKEVFLKLYEKGLIYRGNYIINWCPRCKTALSDEESAHREIDGWLYYIKYPTSQGQYIVVATTRPETMLGDTALAINPKDKRFKWLKDVKVTLPIVQRQLKVIEDEAIDPEFGTGVVKVTPAHDPVDFILGKKHDLESINIMNDDASLNENAPVDFRGMDRFEARKVLVSRLKEKKLLDKEEPYKISVGHCYRCHTIVEPRLSLQWFVKMKPLAQDAKQAVVKDKIKFYPQRWKKVYLHWMDNIQDWCISRQIWWGHQIPVYYCQNCYQAQDSKKGLIVAKEKPSKCPDCGSLEITQDPDVLDTWFSSWLWPFATLGWPAKESDKELKYFYPTSVLVTGSEILFFWVARMVMSGLEFMGNIPFADVIIHGTVRDEKGIKMSKSLGNTIDPLEIIDKFGTDALRFSLIMLASGGSDVYLNQDKFLLGRNFANKIWNATRFILLKAKEKNLSLEAFQESKLQAQDKWILNELNITIDEVTSYLDKYQLNDAAKKLYDFFWHVFCDWYIEIAKDELTSERIGVLLKILSDSMKLLSPFMPFISEEISSLIKESGSTDKTSPLTICSWPQKLKLKVKKDELKTLVLLIETIKEIRNIKADLGINTKKVRIQLRSKVAYLPFLEANKIWLQRLALSDGIDFKNANKQEELKRTLSDNGLWELNLEIEDIDLENYISSLDKKISRLEGLLERNRKMLRNEKFLANAPKAKVDEEENKYKSFKREIYRLTELRDAFK
jgi:valyl-tRNA synthetase